MPRRSKLELEIKRERKMNKYVDALVYAYQKSDSKAIRDLRNCLFQDQVFKSKELTWETIVARALWRVNYASKWNCIN